MNQQQFKWNLEYTGKVNPSPDESIYFNGQPLEPYLPSEELIESVKLAIALKRPLLIMGEPGCGKTKLARAIAYEFTQNNQKLLESLSLEEWPYKTWYVKSTSKARDGLYIYDTLARLRDAQLAKSDQLKSEELKELKDPMQKKYIRIGPLGKAFQNTEIRTVVLIDEIDKADIDFPNDLLLELDEKRFFIEETGQEIPQKNQEVAEPIILITSNNERSLPEAFLRRCFFHYINSPEKDDLIKIIKAHFGELPELVTKEDKEQEVKEMAEELVDRFIALRDSINRGSGKQVSTSELLDWVQALLLSPDDINQKLEKGTPFLGALLKTRDELIRYNQTQRRKTQKQSN
jgi:MoxR-like ATPase